MIGCPVLYYSEQKSKIGTIELSIKASASSLERPVKITSKSLQVSGSDISLNDNTKIKTSDVSHPSVSDSVLNVRIPTDPILTIPSPPKMSNDVKIDKLFCVRCAAQISCRKFTRTLPLPSAAWHEVTGSLLCHGTHSKVVNGCYPRPGDCLVGEQELWVSWNLVDPSAVFIGNVRDIERVGSSRVTSSLHCHRCRNELGRVIYNGDTVDWSIVWKHSIKTRAKEVPYHLESYIAHELLDCSTRHVSYRFIVLPRGTNSSFRGIRVWMMGGDLNITSSLSTHIARVMSHFGQIPCEHTKSMKVLYTKHTEERGQDVWDDADVISLSLDLCLHLWLTLQLSSITLPPNKRYAQGCRVGYIRYS